MSQSLLLQIARQSIMEVLQAERLIDTKALVVDNPLLKTPMATFITLYLDKEVRGCMGSLQAQRTLLEDVIHNAKMAAFQDPRFAPLSTAEYLHTYIELSLLTAPKKLQFDSKEQLQSQIEVQKDGVIIEFEDHAANFLPQVWHEYQDFQTFFTALCQQANISEETALSTATIYTYQVESAFDNPLVK